MLSFKLLVNFGNLIKKNISTKMKLLSKVKHLWKKYNFYIH